MRMRSIWMMRTCRAHLNLLHRCFSPIILILINTVATAMGATTGVWEVLIFLGQPIIAVGLGLLLAIFTLGRNLDRHTALTEMEKGCSLPVLSCL